MAFTIQHGPNLEALAALARSLGERQGHDSARQELEASQQQAFENDYNNRQLQQQADISRQNNRAAMDRVRTSGELDIERVQQQGRIDNYQINRQGAIQQQTNAQNNAAELAERSLLETMQSSPPQIQRQISGVLQQRSVVMSDPSLRPEQRQQLLMELDQNVQRIMDEAAVYQQPDPQQSFDSMRAVDPESGQAYFIGPDGKIEQAAQFHNTPRGLEARLQADIEQARIKTRAELIEGFLERRGQNADGTTRELGDADFAAARRYADNVLAQDAADGIAPGESGGMPTQGPPSLQQAAQQLGIDLSQPPTPENVARLQAAMQGQQNAAGPEAQSQVPPQIQRPVAEAEQAVRSGTNPMPALSAAFTGLGMARGMAQQAAMAAIPLIQKGVPIADAIGMVAQQAARQGAGAASGMARDVGQTVGNAMEFVGINPNAVAATGRVAGNAAMTIPGRVEGVATDVREGVAGAVGEGMRRVGDVRDSVRDDVYLAIGRTIRPDLVNKVSDDIQRYQRRNGNLNLENLSTTQRVDQLARHIAGIPPTSEHPRVTAEQLEHVSAIRETILQWKFARMDAQARARDLAEQDRSFPTVGRRRSEEIVRQLNAGGLDPEEQLRLTFELEEITQRLRR